MGKKESKEKIEEHEMKMDVHEVSTEMVEERKPEEEKTGLPTEEEKTLSSSVSTVEVEEAQEVGGATFDKKRNNKIIFFATLVLVLVVGGVLFARSAGLLSPKNLTYANPVAGYSYTYPEGLQLVAEGSIPAELLEKNIVSMAQLNLTSGDSLLIKNTGDKGKGVAGDNIVYTILDLSSRENFVDFESYKTVLFAKLDETKQSTGVEYVRKDSTVGRGIASVEYSFEMEVRVDEMKTRTGVFYDNIFQTSDGRTYSVSFGYPKDAAHPELYTNIYRQIISSFKPGNIPFVPAVKDVQATSTPSPTVQPQ